MSPRHAFSPRGGRRECALCVRTTAQGPAPGAKALLPLSQGPQGRARPHNAPFNHNPLMLNQNYQGRGGRTHRLLHRTIYLYITVQPTFFLETGFQLRPEQTGRLCVAAAAAGLMRSVLPPSSCTSYLGRVRHGRCTSVPLEHTPCTMQRTTGCPWEMPHEVWAGVTPAARLRSACYDSMALLTMAHQPPASSNLSTRPRSCPMRSTWVRVRVGVRVKVRVRVRVSF